MAEQTDAAVPPSDQSLQQFTANLRVLAENWRYSDEFIGKWVRSRWPARYGQETKP